MLDLSVIEWALFAAGLSLFIEFGFREGNIFDGWLPFVATWWLFVTDCIYLDEIQNASQEEVLLSGYESKREWLLNAAWVVTKPLGYCVVCFNVWVSLGVLFFTPLSGFYSIACYFILSNLVVRFLKEKL